MKTWTSCGSHLCECTALINTSLFPNARSLNTKHHCVSLSDVNVIAVHIIGFHSYFLHFDISKQYALQIYYLTGLKRLLTTAITVRIPRRTMQVIDRWWLQYACTTIIIIIQRETIHRVVMAYHEYVRKFSCSSRYYFHVPLRTVWPVYVMT